MKPRLRVMPKIILSFVFFAAILIFFMGIFVFASGRETLEAAITADLVSTAIEKETAFNRWVDGSLSDIIFLAGLSFVEDNAQVLISSQDDVEVQIAHDRLTSELQSSIAEHTPFSNFLVLHPETGQVIAATNAIEEGRFKENRPYFIQGRSRPFIQNVYFSLQLQEPAMTVSAPIYDANGELVAVLAARLNLAAMSDIMKGYTDLYKTYDAYLLNTSNLLVTQPNFISDPAVLRHGIHTEIVEACLMGSSGSIVTDDYRDVPVVAAFRWIEARELCLVVKVDGAEAFAEIEDGFGASLVLIGIGLLIVSSGLAFGLARTITRPILALKESVVRFGQGELDIRLHVSSQDELGQLAREFNTMANIIIEKEALLQSHARELEDRVVERRRSEMRFKGFLESAPDAMVIVNSAGEIVLVNAQTQNLFGYSAGELIGQSVDILVPEGFRPRHPEHRSEYFTDPHARPMGAGMELFALRKDGTEFPVEISLSPLETDEGVLVSSAIRDITERQQTEKKLRDEHNLLRTVIDNVPDYIFVKNTASKLTLVNHAVIRDVGAASLSDVIGKSDFDILPRELAEEYYAQEQELLRTGEPLINVAGQITVHEEESLRWVLSTKVPLRDSDGNVIGLVGINRDITERWKAEQRFKDLLESAPDAMVIVNSAGEIVLVNAQTQNLFGYSAEELIGQSVEMLVPEGLRQRHPEHRTGYFAEPHARPMGAGKELYALRKDGSEFPVEISLSPLETDEGMLVSSAIRDITESKLAEAKLREYAEALERSNRELESFSYSVSHDLRAPLRALTGFSSILQNKFRDELPEKAQHYLDRIRGNAEQMGNLIDDLLNFSRMGRQPIKKETIDPVAVVNQILQLLDVEDNYPAAKVEIGELPKCWADPTLVKQVFANLVSNALKFSSASAHSRVEIGCQEENGDLVYYVKDNGVGFDMKYSDKLFGVFQRLHDDEQYEGTGIGLANVHRAVSRHGGRVWAESAVGKGATFYFTVGKEKPRGRS